MAIFVLSGFAIAVFLLGINTPRSTPTTPRDEFLAYCETIDSVQNCEERIIPFYDRYPSIVDKCFTTIDWKIDPKAIDECILLGTLNNTPLPDTP